jgi:adenylate cyclase
MFKNSIVVILSLLALCIYLFAEAPMPLPDRNGYSGEELVPMSTVFNMLATENSAARGLYTRRIVGDGKIQKLRFHERWHNDTIEAGPLPALFLRETAIQLEKSGVRLGLFLGSDFPIVATNKLIDNQLAMFEQMKIDKKPRFFYDENTQRHTAMFIDIASTAACVSCHNEHPNSPKTDWKLGDIMGATTWTFPKDSVSMEEVRLLLASYRQSAAGAYTAYLEKMNKNKKNKIPEMGAKWPHQGYFLPSTAVFMDSLNTLTAKYTLNTLLNLSNKDYVVQK